MKQIMTFELYKSTYMSAADKLEQGHKKRSEELKKHAAEKGISAFAGKEGFDRIYGHPFVFQNQFPHREKFLGKFFITDFKNQLYGRYNQSYHGIGVIMKSDYGNTIQVDVVTCPDKEWVKMDLEYQMGNSDRTTEEKNFLFENRKDALEFRKAVLEYVEDELYDYEEASEYFNLKTMPINKLYKTV
jgi:hypothetical protein